MALFRISGRASVASGDLTLEDAEGLSVRDGGSWFWRWRPRLVEMTGCLTVGSWDPLDLR